MAVQNFLWIQTFINNARRIKRKLAVFVYDIATKDTFDHTNVWFTFINEIFILKK